ncbi:DUF3784 domain-containing protein [Alistipes sp. OttesenSCG-928-L06]|nr:DUF3784 domain-containing protein [Alistipes sp. OttesenSCG-928-L06]
MIVYIIILLYGLLFIGMGFFVKKYPDTIAGYNTLSSRRKKQVDIEGLSTFLKKVLIGIGIGIVPLCAVLWFLGLEEAFGIALWVIPLLVLIATAIRARKYTL